MDCTVCEFRWRGSGDEKNLPTQQQEEKEDPWVQGSHENQERSQNLERETTQGPETYCRLSSERFPRWERLRKRREFRRVYDQGARVAASHLVVFALEVPHARSSRLGVTVTKKVGGSVVRSRCKRRVRELFRRRVGRLCTTCDIVVNVRKGSAEVQFSTLEEEFTASLERLNDLLYGRQRRKKERQQDVK